MRKGPDDLGAIRAAREYSKTSIPAEPRSARRDQRSILCHNDYCGFSDLHRAVDIARFSEWVAGMVGVSGKLHSNSTTLHR